MFCFLPFGNVSFLIDVSNILVGGLEENGVDLRFQARALHEKTRRSLQLECINVVENSTLLGQNVTIRS